MQHSKSLLFLIIIAIFGGFAVIYGAIFIIDETQLDSVSSVPIYAGVMGFLATIITSIFQEISSRHKEKRDTDRKLWELIFPIMMDGYIPWIEHAKKLSKALKKAKILEYDDYSINLLLYYMCLFYGLRIRFLLKYGGMIILRSNQDEIEIDTAYQQIKKAFIWEGEETERYISQMQEFFMKCHHENKDILFKTFEAQLRSGKSEYDFPECKKN